MENKKYNILFVCSSNVCRSPYCEFMLRRMIENDDLLRGRVEVKSSAVFNKSKRIFPKAVDILKREGFDEKEILAHKPSFKTDTERFEKADVIIGMSKMHRLLTPRRYRDKYITLSEAATGEYAPMIRFLPRRKSRTTRRWTRSNAISRNILQNSKRSLKKNRTHRNNKKHA